MTLPTNYDQEMAKALNMNPVNHGIAICIECSKEFVKKATNQITCGMDCNISRERRMIRAWRKKRKELKDAM